MILTEKTPDHDAKSIQIQQLKEENDALRLQNLKLEQQLQKSYSIIREAVDLQAQEQLF